MSSPAVGGVRPGPTGFRRALDSLEEAGVGFSLRKAGPAGTELPTEGELDIWLGPGDVAAGDAALARAGFHRFQAPGEGRRRFYLSFEEGRWLKVDAKLGKEPGGSEAAGGGTVEQFIARHLTPRPDAVIVLALGPEHERWRRMYAKRFDPRGVTIITTADPPKAALARASEAVWAALRERRSW